MITIMPDIINKLDHKYLDGHDVLYENELVKFIIFDDETKYLESKWSYYDINRDLYVYNDKQYYILARHKEEFYSFIYEIGKDHQFIFYSFLNDYRIHIFQGDILSDRLTKMLKDIKNKYIDYMEQKVFISHEEQTFLTTNMKRYPKIFMYLFKQSDFLKLYERANIEISTTEIIKTYKDIEYGEERDS